VISLAFDHPLPPGPSHQRGFFFAKSKTKTKIVQDFLVFNFGVQKHPKITSGADLPEKTGKAAARAAINEALTLGTG